MPKTLVVFLKLSLKILVVLFAFTFLGVLIPFVYGRALDDGRFVKWQKLAQPPEQVEKLLAPDYIKSSSATIYKYSPAPFSPPGACGIDCWDKVDTVSNNDSNMLPLRDCGWLPDLESYSDFVATCEVFGPGGTLTRILARDQRGLLYSWTNGKGEGNVHIMVYSVMFGAVIGFIVGFTVAVIIVISDLSRRKR